MTLLDETFDKMYIVYDTQVIITNLLINSFTATVENIRILIFLLD